MAHQKDSRLKLDDTNQTGKPFARIQVHGRQIKIVLYTAVQKICNFKPKERVDLYWKELDKVWKKPILIIKRGGTQRAVSLHFGKYKQAFSISIGRIVKQYEIPLHKHPLPILDFIDDEIWIDFSGEMEKETPRHKYWSAKFGTASRYQFQINKYLSIHARMNTEFLKFVRKVAKEEGTTTSGLVLKLIQERIEDRHPDIWYEMLNKFEE